VSECVEADLEQSWFSSFAAVLCHCR
jgi:hypothetical protein